jgi:predicted DNA binding CopG/RHH family protein
VRPIKKAEVSGVKRVNINLEISLHNAFKAATAAQGVDMTTVLQQFIESYVARYGASASQKKGRRA